MLPIGTSHMSFVLVSYALFFRQVCRVGYYHETCVDSFELPLFLTRQGAVCASGYYKVDVSIQVAPMVRTGWSDQSTQIA